MLACKRRSLALVLAHTLSLSLCDCGDDAMLYIYLSLNTIECIQKYTPNNHTFFCFSGSGTDLFRFSFLLCFRNKTKQNRKHWFGFVSLIFWCFWIFSISWLKEIKEVHIDDNKQTATTMTTTWVIEQFRITSAFIVAVWGAHKHTQLIMGFISLCLCVWDYRWRPKSIIFEAKNANNASIYF